MRLNPVAVAVDPEAENFGLDFFVLCGSIARPERFQGEARENALEVFGGPGAEPPVLFPARAREEKRQWD